MTEISQSNHVASEWVKGWPIVLSSLVGIALCLSPLPYWALIVIGPELGKEFGWSRETIQAGFLAMTMGVLFGAPIAKSTFSLWNFLSISLVFVWDVTHHMVKSDC